MLPPHQPFTRKAVRTTPVTRSAVSTAGGVPRTARRIALKAPIRKARPELKVLGRSDEDKS
jgi:hypothetical protein